MELAGSSVQLIHSTAESIKAVNSTEPQQRNVPICE